MLKNKQYTIGTKNSEKRRVAKIKYLDTRHRILDGKLRTLTDEKPDEYIKLN